MTPQQFKSICQALGLSDSEMALSLGLSDRTIRRYKSGEWPVNEQSKIILGYMVQDANRGDWRDIEQAINEGYYQ